jgi:hypothetical protein
MAEGSLMAARAMHWLEVRVRSGWHALQGYGSALR